jgi:hypothetical protein
MGWPVARGGLPKASRGGTNATPSLFYIYIFLKKLSFIYIFNIFIYIFYYNGRCRFFIRYV